MREQPPVPQTVAEFLELLHSTAADSTWVRLLLSDCVRKGDSEPCRITIRPVQIRGTPLFQLANSFERRETHENLSLNELRGRLTSLLDGRFRQIRFETSKGDYDIAIPRTASFRGKFRHVSRTPVTTAHNRAKQYLIPEGVPCAFLEQIGVMTSQGQVRAAMQHKFRQINRFLEFVEDIYPHLPAQGTIHVIDFGCGKSYLTFAIHHLLALVHQREVNIEGWDQNPEIVQTCSSVAARVGATGLSFKAGRIENTRSTSNQESQSPGPQPPVPRPSSPSPLHLAVSLHACNTATDEALTAAVAWGANVILAAPCCHQEVADQIQIPSLACLIKHGILKERFAALATDALRAAALEAAGYQTQVMEFVDLEHTPKNLLLRAIRRSGHVTPATEYHEFRSALGLRSVAIDHIIEAAVQRENKPGSEKAE